MWCRELDPQNVISQQQLAGMGMLVPQLPNCILMRFAFECKLERKIPFPVIPKAVCAFIKAQQELSYGRIHKVLRLSVCKGGIFLQNTKFFTLLSAKQFSSNFGKNELEITLGRREEL